MVLAMQNTAQCYGVLLWCTPRFPVLISCALNALPKPLCSVTQRPSSMREVQQMHAAVRVSHHEHTMVIWASSHGSVEIR